MGELAKGYGHLSLDEINNLLAQLQQLNKKGLYSEALVLVDNLLSAFPALYEAIRIKSYILMSLDDYSGAHDLIDQVLSQQPTCDAWMCKGLIYKRMNQRSDSLACFFKGYELAEGRFDICACISSELIIGEEYARAEKFLSTEAKKNRGEVSIISAQAYLRVWGGDNQQAFEYFKDSIQVANETRKNIKDAHIFAHKLTHDYQQIEYLIDQGLIKRDNIINKYYDDIDRLADLFDRNALGIGIALDSLMLPLVDVMFNQSIHLRHAGEIKGGALNPDLNYEKLEEQYLDASIKMVCIDDFLKEEALVALRMAGHENTMWKTVYKNGYLGAFGYTGFISPLVLQIAAEIKSKMPRIFVKERLQQTWSFKCVTKKTGITLHADFAVVNLNLWVSEEDANLDKSSGGLLVWDKPPPSDWGFEDYNRNQLKSREFLRRAQASPVNIPHKENRILIFDSALFHETDQCDFKDEYTKRRQNVTFLYGQNLTI